MTSRTGEQSREAFEAGLRAGEAAAKESSRRRYTRDHRPSGHRHRGSGRPRAETIRRAEADTVRLAIEIARRVLHRELSVDPSALEALIKAALEKLQAQEIYRVRVHPDQEKSCAPAWIRCGRGQAIEVVTTPRSRRAARCSKSAAARWTLPSKPNCAKSSAASTDQLEARS